MTDEYRQVEVFLYRCSECSTVQATTVKCDPAEHMATCPVCKKPVKVYPVWLTVPERGGYERFMTSTPVSKSYPLAQDPSEWLVKPTDQNPDSTYGIICKTDGKQGLTAEDYNRQMKRDNWPWQCPVCQGVAAWDFVRYDKGIVKAHSDA